MDGEAGAILGRDKALVPGRGGGVVLVAEAVGLLHLALHAAAGNASGVRVLLRRTQPRCQQLQLLLYPVGGGGEVGTRSWLRGDHGS